MQKRPALAGHRRGSGPPLLVLPGLGSTWAEFEAVLPLLADRYDVLALDLPGQGESPPLPPDVVPDVAALTDAVEHELTQRGVDVPHVLGVSLGARVGLELARRQCARSVVAIAPVGPVTPPERVYQALVLAASRFAFGVLAPAADLVLRFPLARTAALLPLRARGWRASPEEAAALVRAFAHAPDFWRLLRYAVAPEHQLDHTAVRCPVVVAQGTHDLISLSQAARLAALVPGARFRLLPLAGHSSVGDVPESVVRLVDEAVADAAGA
ncbi:MAG: alpha/beta hydrolase [Actinomycetota bacterium]|nr:alpha/beta hydrolase [Actinomycetota bacterium]